MHNRSSFVVDHRWNTDSPRQSDIGTPWPYRVVADDLLWVILTNNVFDTLPAEFRFCDVGGNSNKWLFEVLAQYPFSTGIRVCRSEQEVVRTLHQRDQMEYGARLEVIYASSLDTIEVATRSCDVAFTGKEI